MDAKSGKITPKNTHLMPPWVPGQSGNLSGRPKGSVGLAAQIRVATREGMELIEFWLTVFRGDPVPTPGRGGQKKRPTLRHRQEAAEWLTDHGFGKAIQTTDLNLSGLEGIDLVLHRGKDGEKE